MVGSSTWVTRLSTLPKRAITFGASVRGMWMIWLTSRLNVKPSVERTVMVREVLVELVRLGLAGRPVEHDVGGRHGLDLVREGVDRVLARIERLDPDAFLALCGPGCRA